jgi:lipopolysaccharide export system permease protein
VKTLDRYIWKKFFVSFLGSLLLLIIVLVAIDVAEKIDDFVERQVPIQALWQYYQNFIPFYANLLSPLVVFIAVLFFTGQMAQRSEIVALMGGGVSLWRLLRPYLLAAGLVSLTSLYLQMQVTPRNVRGIERFEYKYIKNRTYFDQRQIHIKLSPEGYIFIRAFDKFDYLGFGAFLERIEGARLKARYAAEEVAWIDSTKKWRFFRVWVYEAEKPPKWISQIDTTLPLVPADIIRSEFYTRTMAYDELLAEYRRQAYVGGEVAALLEVELHERVAVPMTSVILTAIGVAAASRKRRGGVALQIGLGLVLAFIYVLLLVLAKSLWPAGVGQSWISVWIPNALFSAIAAWWLWRVR